MGRMHKLNLSDVTLYITAFAGLLSILAFVLFGYSASCYTQGPMIVIVAAAAVVGWVCWLFPAPTAWREHALSSAIVWSLCLLVQIGAVLHPSAEVAAACATVGGR